MQRLALSMILCVTVIPYLAAGDFWGRGKILPGFFAFAPEFISALAAVIVVAQAARNGFRYVRPAYWIVFGSLIVLMLFSAIANNLGSGPVIAGLRLYLRSLPWFLIPALAAFSDDQIRTQLKLLLAVCLLQVPLAIEQRIYTANASYGFVAVTGDWTTGTLTNSGILSMFLICAVCVAAALQAKGHLTLWQFIVLFCVVLVPTTINETKVTMVFLPVGLLAAFTFAAERGLRMRRMFSAIGVLVVFGAIFVPVYDAMNADRQYGVKLLDFTDAAVVEQYLGGANSESGPGRTDAVTYPLKRLSQDPVSLAFGYGIGNASNSSFGSAFSGEHFLEFEPYLQSSLARFLLELGVLGVAGLVLIFVLIIQDCMWLSRSGHGVMSAFAAGWIGVTAVIGLSLLYVLAEVYPSISYLFWYGSGLAAAARMRMLYPARERSALHRTTAPA